MTNSFAQNSELDMSSSNTVRIAQINRALFAGPSLLDNALHGLELFFLLALLLQLQQSLCNCHILQMSTVSAHRGGDWKEHFGKTSTHKNTDTCRSLRTNTKRSSPLQIAPCI